MSNRGWLVALLFSVPCSFAWAQSPAGSAFRVNSSTAGGQYRPAVDSDANGEFVVV